MFFYKFGNIFSNKNTIFCCFFLYLLIWKGTVRTLRKYHLWLFICLQIVGFLWAIQGRTQTTYLTVEVFMSTLRKQLFFNCVNDPLNLKSCAKDSTSVHIFWRCKIQQLIVFRSSGHTFSGHSIIIVPTELKVTQTVVNLLFSIKYAQEFKETRCNLY